MDEFVFLLLFGETDEQGGQGRYDIKHQGSELAVMLRNPLKPIENQKHESKQDGKGYQQRPTDALEGMRKEVRCLVHCVLLFCKCNLYFTFIKINFTNI